MSRKQKAAASKKNTKILKTQKRRRRQWITSLRMVRYGVNNFTRNAWLTIAATAVMTITLLSILTTVVAQNVLHSSVQTISDKVDMSIYLKTDTTEKQANEVITELKREVENVRAVQFISSEEAKDDNAKLNKADPDVIDAISEATNKLPATLRIQLNDINDTSGLQRFVNKNETVKKYLDEEREPSFAGPRRAAIEQIAQWTVLAQRVGIVASLIFVIISSLIIFNTIRMAIFSRKEEIQMMKLIGADKHFIRGPFVVEAIMYGFIAALLATGIGFGLLSLVQEKLSAFGVNVQSTLDLMTVYVGFVLLAMIALGAIIGTISSLLATQRYLKI